MLWLSRACLAAGLLLLAACQTLDAGVSAPSLAELEGIWRVHNLAGQPVAADSRTRIEFSAPPRLTGNASCNRFFGVYAYQNGQLTIEESLGASKMLCRPSLMAQENEFLALLPRSARVRLHDDVLEVLDAQGKLLIKAERGRMAQP